jgi:hypothetical protein
MASVLERIPIGNVGMRWFGVKWEAPICEIAPHVETPYGVPCLFCDVPITASDRGLFIPTDVPGDVPGHFIQQERPAHVNCLLFACGIGERPATWPTDQ